MRRRAIAKCAMACRSIGMCRSSMDDGLVLQSGRVPPGEGRQISGDPDLRALCQGPRLPGGLSERLATHGREASRRRRGLDATNTRTGRWSIRRSGCRTITSACASIRAAAAARRAIIDHFSPRETKDFYDCIEWAGVAALVERQGRAQRHFLLRHEPVARRVAAAAAPGGDVRLGGRRRLVSRHDASRRHSLAPSGPTGTTCRSRPCSTASASAAAAAAIHGELVCGPETLSRGGARREPLRFRRRDPRPSARR